MNSTTLSVPYQRRQYYQRKVRITFCFFGCCLKYKKVSIQSHRHTSRAGIPIGHSEQVQAKADMKTNNKKIINPGQKERNKKEKAKKALLSKRRKASRQHSTHTYVLRAYCCVEGAAVGTWERGVRGGRQGGGRGQTLEGNGSSPLSQRPCGKDEGWQLR